MTYRNDDFRYDNLAILHEARKLRAEVFADLMTGFGRRIAALFSSLRGQGSRTA
ncbi:MAG: hypothetical protein WCZ72_11255 [Gemmobacter sp.]